MPPTAEATLTALEIFSKIACDTEGDATTLRCTWKKKVSVDEAAERAIAALVNASVSVRSAAPEQSRLEDVFAELTDEGGPVAASEPPEKPS